MESDRRPGIRDVAKAAGVAVSSVSRVLADHPDVSDAMRDRVHEAVDRIGYRPNTLAQGLRSGRSMSIGFLVGDISNPLMAEIALSAESRLSAEGYTVLIANAQGDVGREISNIRMLENRHIDGLLFSTYNESDPALSEAIRSFSGPVILLDREMPGLTVPSICFDHFRGFTDAVHRLIELGHVRIALIGGEPGVRPTRERIHAVREACASARIPEPQICVGTFDRSQGAKAVHELFAEDSAPPTAVICGANQILPGVLEAFRSLGLRMPGDVSLVTTDRSDLAELHEPELAAITRDATALGMAAADALLQVMSGGDPITRELQTQFRDGPSIGSPTRS